MNCSIWPQLLAIGLALLSIKPAPAEPCDSPAVGYKVMQLAGRTVAVWYPTTATPKPYAYGKNFSSELAVNAPAGRVCGASVPLVVFSHGDLGCGLQSIAFTEELARHGYVVAAPDHADALLCHIVRPSGQSRRPVQPNFLKPETWSDKTFADRRADIEATIDGLLADADFQSVIDAQSIGVAGHSLGGYTVVGMAGGWTSWIDARIRAVLAFSPYVLPFQVRQTLAAIQAPLMYQGGTLDIGITPFLKGAHGAYSQANPPAFLVELKNAGHFAWANCGDAHTTASCLAERANNRLINEYAIAFFDSYLKREAKPILTEANAQLASYQFKLTGKQ